MLDGDDIVYVVRVPTQRIMNVSITLGTRFPAYCTSMGRVLLAALPVDELDAYLARVRLEPLTPRTVTDARLRQAVHEPGPAATPSSTRSWRAGCARWRSRSSTPAATPWRPSTSRPTPAGSRSRTQSGPYLGHLIEAADKINADLRTVSVAAGRVRLL